MASEVGTATATAPTARKAVNLMDAAAATPPQPVAAAPTTADAPLPPLQSATDTALNKGKRALSDVQRSVAPYLHSRTPISAACCGLAAALLSALLLALLRPSMVVKRKESPYDERRVIDVPSLAGWSALAGVATVLLGSYA